MDSSLESQVELTVTMDPQLANALAMLRRRDADGIKRLLDEQLALYNAKKNLTEQPKSKPILRPTPTTKRAAQPIEQKLTRQASSNKVPKLDIAGADKKKIAKIHIPKASIASQDDSETKSSKTAFGMFSKSGTTSVEVMDVDEDSKDSSSGAKLNSPKPGSVLGGLAGLWTSSFANKDGEKEMGSAEATKKSKEKSAEQDAFITEIQNSAAASAKSHKKKKKKEKSSRKTSLTM